MKIININSNKKNSNINILIVMNKIATISKKLLWETYYLIITEQLMFKDFLWKHSIKFTLFNFNNNKKKYLKEIN